MIKVRQQLKAFHKAQGLRGKRLKRAVWADIGRVKSNRDFVADPWLPLSYLFSFSCTPEGFRYWRERADK